MRCRDLLTLASAISGIRLALAIGMPFWLDSPYLLALYLFAVATDVLDGAVARSTGTCSRSGAALDGWVDKVLIVNLGWGLALADRIPDWWVGCWCAREVVQAPLVLILGHRFRTAKVPPPRTTVLGKMTAFSVFGAIVSVLVGYPSLVLTVITGLLGLGAGLQYGLIYLFGGTDARTQLVGFPLGVGVRSEIRR